MTSIAPNPVAYVILTSKPGQYRTEATGKLTPTEAWDYVYCGRHLATFVIATLYGDARIRVTDESSDAAVNDMPIRFLERFPDRDAAFKALQILVGTHHADAQLRQRAEVSAA
jgi:hypothetical protein